MKCYMILRAVTFELHDSYDIVLTGFVLVF